MVESPKTGSEEFGDAVRRARERLGMSRRDLAETTGLSYPYISQIETGYRMPSTPAMRTLADALGLRPDRLFDAIPPAAGRDAGSARPSVPAPPAPVAPAAAAPTPPAAAPMPPAAPPLADVPITAPRGFAPPGPAAPTATPTAAPTAAPKRAAIRREESTRSVRAAEPTEPAGTVDRMAADPAAADTAFEPPERGAVTGSIPVGYQQDQSDGEGAPATVTAGVAGSWIANRSYGPIAAPRTLSAASAPILPAGTVAPLAGDRAQAIEHAAALLTSLSVHERLPALTEVQARVVRSVVDDEIRGSEAR